ncbi:hypothetical protein LPB137_08565 [Poseidonibacter parvus]|uniref:Cytochrome c domain-containing protein n=1 Tax=Poseidonibacter parvus TaxID=1850254 RepID=A0A1P8KN01_9BACT|nr:hypothetical protein [Poseidonibacter parvus]APW65905.1 hypothetical protein LPB137_08565 [Poseidonibacter parvus]
MAKIILTLILLISFLNAEKTSKNIYESNCIKCHNKLPVSIDKYFYRYLLKYSSENSVKESMFWYLKKPNKDMTIMPDAFIKRFGIKKKTKLSDKKLYEALDIYWEKYKVFGKLK